MHTLHPQLKQDCLYLGHSELSHLLLVNDARFPWFLLVPDRENISELIELSDQDRQQLHHESYILSKAMLDCLQPDKLNIACIGNVVPQLHMHHVARFTNDDCWPAPVWGQGEATPYTNSNSDRLINSVKDAIKRQKALDISWSETVNMI